jgi:lambda repressor-like predicted transcriptional regulator
MHPEQIKAALRMQGVTPTALAEKLGVSNASVSQVISGRAESARIKAGIAAIVGLPVSSLWKPKAPSPLRRVKSQKVAA